MPAFPRTGVAPASVTLPQFPGALQSWGASGKGQARSVQQVGRIWTETWAALDLSLPAVRALVAAINRFWRDGTTFTINHIDLQVPKGIGGGTPLVAGAGQTGSSLLVDGAPVSTTNWLRDGDIIAVSGVGYVLDVAGDVNTDGVGAATVPIAPPIFAGGSPLDNAAVTISGVLFNARISRPPNLPPVGAAGIFDGLEVTFREAP